TKVRKESDPIDNLRDKLIAAKITNEAALKEIDKDIKAVVTAAADFAQASEEPDPAELYTDILVEV
ncbi:MAG: pyruvate dehydrogenase (acetyl-transferring) E1 component subunit alpha, partial [Rhodospirillales bacterium]|nr:pyruvate dehydrogenase (acetyl-transferring) E1 component subunit alpha [Rhodospirillales bacterium]